MKVNGTFSEFQLWLAETYGSAYGAKDEEDITSDLEIDDPWVICPECGEPIYMRDCLGNKKTYWDCPACCCVEDETLEV